jgi:hypothetical protein
MSIRDGVLPAIYLSTGLIWTGRSILEVVAHPDYWDPVAAVDWIAVWTFSLALFLLAATLVGVAADSGSGGARRVIGGVAAVAALVAGLANAIEDGFDVEMAAPVYAVGALITVAAMVVFAVALGISGRPRWFAAVLLMVVGVVTISAGFGVLVLMGAGVATWARRSRTTTTGK